VTVFRVRFRTKVKRVGRIHAYTHEHTLRTTRTHVNAHKHTQTHTHAHAHTHTHALLHTQTHTFTNLKTRKDTHHTNTFMSKKVTVPALAHRKNAPFNFRSLLARFLISYI